MKKHTLSAKIQKKLQDIYNKKARRAVRHHNKVHPQEPWELMEKSRYHKKMAVFTEKEGTRYFNLLAYRIRIKGKRGKGSTFTFTGDMILPYSHHFIGQAAYLMIVFLKRSDKDQSQSEWCQEVLNPFDLYDICPRMLRLLFDSLCTYLKVTFGERPMKLYRCASRTPKVLEQRFLEQPAAAK